MQKKMSSKVYFILAPLIGLAAAVPAAEVDNARCQPHFRCEDGLNECGIRYGGLVHPPTQIILEHGLT